MHVEALGHPQACCDCQGLRSTAEEMEGGLVGLHAHGVHVLRNISQAILRFQH